MSLGSGLGGTFLPKGFPEFRVADATQTLENPFEKGILQTSPKTFASSLRLAYLIKLFFRGSLLSDAEAREYAGEQVVGVDGANDLAQGGERLSQRNGDVRHAGAR